MIISGKNSVLESLKSGGKGIEKIYIAYGTSDDIISVIKGEAKKIGVAVSIMDRRKFADLEKREVLSGRSQGVLALMNEIEYENLETIIENVFKEGKIPFVVALDGITDPHNLGAIIRSAECAGCDAVIISKKDSVSVNETVMRTSAGAAKHIPVCREDNLVDSLRSLKVAGLEIVGLSEHCKNDYTKESFLKPICIVIGNEGDGFTQQVKRECTSLVRINMLGKINSLNASVAAAVVISEINRQKNLVI